MTVGKRRPGYFRAYRGLRGVRELGVREFLPW